MSRLTFPVLPEAASCLVPVGSLDVPGSPPFRAGPRHHAPLTPGPLPLRTGSEARKSAHIPCPATCPPLGSSRLSPPRVWKPGGLGPGSVG